MSRQWRDVGRAPLDFFPECLLARPDGSGLLLGYTRRGAASLTARRAAVLVADAHGLELTLDVPGWVVCGDLLDDERGFLVLARALPGGVGASYELWATADGGRSWTSRGPMTHATSVTSILALSDDEVWALEAGSLLVGRSGAADWAPVEAPVELDWTRDRLFLLQGAVALATPAGLFVAGEGGEGWKREAVDDAHVRALSEPFVAALRQGRVHIGRLRGGSVEWLGHIDEPADPIEMVAAGGDLQLTCIPADLERHAGIALIENLPQGGFTTSLIHVPPWPSWISIAGARGALALSVDREVICSSGV